MTETNHRLKMQLLSPKGYWSLLRKVFFDPISLNLETAAWTKAATRLILIQFSIYNLCIIYSLITICIVGLRFIVSDLYFPEAVWAQSLLISVTIGIGVAFAVGIGIGAGLIVGMTKNVVKGLTLEAILSAAFLCSGAIAVGIAIGMAADMSIEPVLVDYFDLGLALALGLGIGYAGCASFGVWFGTIIGISLTAAITTIVDGKIGITFLAGYTIAFYSSLYWPFYLFPLLIRMNVKTFPHQKWDEDIGLPIPFISKILLNQAAYNKDSAIHEAEYLIRNKPVCRKGAQKGLICIAMREMRNFTTIQKIAYINRELHFLPQLEGYFSEDYALAFKSILNFSRDCRIALDERNAANMMLQMKKLVEKLSQFQSQMDFTRGNIAFWFGGIASSWHLVIKKELSRLESEREKPLPNPFVTGNPILPEFIDVFVGRRDIINQIQTETLRQGGSGAILFIGKRRSGKTSTLINLRSFLSSDIIPIFTDGQSPTINSSLDQFVKVIAKEIRNALHINTISPWKDNNLAKLTEFMEKLQSQLADKGLHILICFDEFEKLSEKIIDGTLSGLPDTLRHWIQHLPKIICLFASSHPPNEIVGIRWTDYLINVRTIPISYLDFNAALDLVTKPIPEFDLIYHPPEISDRLVRRLGGQPYLLQVVMFELVQFLNERNRKSAKQDDIDFAIVKMFETASIHFHYVWEEELDRAEREALLALARQKSMNPDFEKSLKSLIRKEILLPENRSYDFCIPVMREWILKNV